MLQNCNCYHCREDGMVELLDYTLDDIPDIRNTLLYTCATSDLFEVDFCGLFNIEPCEWLDIGKHDYRIFGSQFLEVQHVAIGRCSHGVKGRLGALKGLSKVLRPPIKIALLHPRIP